MTEEKRNNESRDGQIEVRNSEQMKISDKALGRESMAVKKKRDERGWNETIHKEERSSLLDAGLVHELAQLR